MCAPGPGRATYGRVSPRWPVEALASFSCTSLYMFLYRADRGIVGCHLVRRGCGMTRSCVLGANALFPTEYDGKGNGLARLAWHMPMVGTHEAICNMPRQRPAAGSQITGPAAIACASCVNSGSSHVVAVCSCTKQTDVMSSVTSLAGGAGRREY